MSEEIITVDNQTQTQISKEDRKRVRTMNLRSLAMGAPLNYGNMQGSGFLYCLLPFINDYFKEDEEGRRAALKRSTSWFNCTQNTGTFIMGLSASMEVENSKRDDFDPTSISAVKASLMGPLSGIGDTIFWGILRILAAGIAIPFALQGSFLAPIIFLLVYNIPSLITRFGLGTLGFTVGDRYITEMYESGLMDIITKAASILGLVVLGGMTGSLVNLETTLQWDLGGGNVIILQEYLDQMFLGILPLLFTLVSRWLLDKKEVNFTVLILLTIVFGILLSMFGIA